MFIKSVLQKGLVAVFALNVLGVSGNHLVDREWKGVRGVRRRNITDVTSSTSPAITIPGLANLQSYVCPTNSHLAARQAATSISLTSTDIVSLFQQLEAILATLETILKAQGLYTSAIRGSVQTTTSVNAAGSTVVAITTSRPAQVTQIPQSVLENSSGVVYVTVTATTTVFMDSEESSTSAVPATFTQPIVTTTPQAAPSIVTIATTIMSTQQTIVNSPGASPSTRSSFYVVTSVSMLTSSVLTAAPQSTMMDDDCEDEPAVTVTVVASSTAYVGNVAASSTTNAGGIFVVTSASNSYSAAATSSSGYTFNSQSNTNVAAYFGQTPVTSGSSLLAQCADPNIDVAILAFVVSNNYQGSIYPLVNYGAACGGQTDAMRASAPGLLSCPDLASMISTCHTTYGKKVMMSIGGSASGISFTTASQATDFANVLWKLFGPPGLIDINLRPFGNVSIDGFDIDNEDNLPANFDVLGTTLKTLYTSDPSKTYYLSSAPQCPFPDASDPGALILACDFVFIQFYNNAPCEIGSAGFISSLQQWSSYLQTSTQPIKPKMYVGAPAWSAAGPSAYANIGSAEGMYKVAQQVKAQNLPNLGGVMFWDGAEGMLNVQDGKDIIAWAKAGLTSS